MNPVKLTMAQAEVVRELLNGGWGLNDCPFQPAQAFPKRNNRHNGMRRVCRTLAKKGILRKTTVNYGNGPLPAYLLNEQMAYNAFHAWAAKRDYDFSCFR